jgi:adenylate cyclase
MNARLERKLRALAIVTISGLIAGLAFAVTRGVWTFASIEAGLIYGLLISLTLGGIELFVMEGPANDWLGSLSFTANLIVRSAIYAAIIVPIQYFELGVLLTGQRIDSPRADFWRATVYSAAISVLMNLVLVITNLIGRRALLNFITGRYHAPVEENRFVLFVDIAGSTGLAERLGGVGIHCFLDRTFRLLTLAVVDYHGEVLNYVGDEVIVTWPQSTGSVDCRPLRCFIEMRAILLRGAGQFERDFGAVPRIRGSLHFGPVIIGEIGDVKRAIVFNGDVMNTAARLEELSRAVEGGFLASRIAMQQFKSASPFPVRDLGEFHIRGRKDGIDVVGLDAPASSLADGFATALL